MHLRVIFHVMKLTYYGLVTPYWDTYSQYVFLVLWLVQNMPISEIGSNYAVDTSSW